MTGLDCHFGRGTYIGIEFIVFGGQNYFLEVSCYPGHISQTDAIVVNAK